MPLILSVRNSAQCLVSLAMDPNPDVRRLVCAGLVALMSNVPERLHANLHEVVRYMLARNQDGDAAVALESCEFWCAFCDSEHLGPEFLAVLREFIPALAPVLLANMRFPPDDEEVEAAEEAERRGPAPDRDQDVRPAARLRDRGAAGDDGGGEEGDEGGGAGGEEDGWTWNLRKSSASSLDSLSNCFPDELLPVLLPLIEARLGDPDWRVREASVLALGAVAEGCEAGLAPLAPQIVRGLLSMNDDPRPMLRAITCWTLGRFSRWVAEAAADAPQRPPSAPSLHDSRARARAAAARAVFFFLIRSLRMHRRCWTRSSRRSSSACSTGAGAAHSVRMCLPDASPATRACSRPHAPRLPPWRTPPAACWPPARTLSWRTWCTRWGATAAATCGACATRCPPSRPRWGTPSPPPLSPPRCCPRCWRGASPTRCWTRSRWW